MAFNVGELVATIRTGGLQAFQSQMGQARGEFQSTGRAAEQQGAQAEASGRRSVAAARGTAEAARKAGKDQQAAAKGVQAATQATTQAVGRETSATRETGTAGTAAGRAKVRAERESAAAAGVTAGAFARQKSALDAIGGAMVLVGGAGVAGFIAAGRANAEFSARLAQVKSLSHGTQADMQALGQAALTMGTQFGLSANDVADAQIEEVKAGISVKQQLGGALAGALQLAAAGQIDVAQATEIATVAMTQFHTPAQKVTHVADLLAAGADKALGGVGDLGFALKSGGLVASQFGLSIEDTVGTLSAFANAGLIGENAGTALRQMLLQLASPSKQSRELMDKLGISAYDASGKFVGIANLAGQLREKLKPLPQAQRDAAEAIIFGAHSISAANVLYNEGATGIAKWSREVNDSGFAAQQAAGKMDSLQGDQQKLSAAFQTGLIQAGQSVNGELRGMVQGVTDVLVWFNRLPEPLKAIATNAAGAGGGVALISGAIVLGIPRLIEFGSSLEALSSSRIPAVAGAATRAAGLIEGGMLGLSRVAAFATGPFGLALAGVATAIAILSAKEFPKAAVSADDLTSSLDQTTGAMTSLTRATIAKGLQDNGTFDKARRLGLSLEDVTSAAMGNKDATLRLASAMQLHQDQLQGNLAAQTQYGVESQKFIQALGLQSQATRDAAAKQRELMQATGAATKEGRQFQNQAEKTATATAQYGKGLDQATAAGQSNRQNLADLVAAGESWLLTSKNQGVSAKELASNQMTVRESVFQAASAMTSSRGAAIRLAAQYLKIPKRVLTQLLADDKPALEALKRAKKLAQDLNDIKPTIFVTVKGQVLTPDQKIANALQQGKWTFAGGGPMPDVGPKGQDSFLIAAGAGEHMWSAKDVDAAGGQGAVYRIRAAARAGTLSGYATGGAIGNADSARHAAEREAIRLQARLVRQKREADAAARAEKRAQNAYDSASGSGAKSSARRELKAAQAHAKALAATVERTQRERDDARQRAKDEASRAQELRQSREDLSIANSRGQYTDPSNPFSATDLALQESRNQNLSAAQRRRLDTVARTSNTSMLGLAKQADDAQKAIQADTDALQDAQTEYQNSTTALQSLKDAAAGLASQVASTVQGFFSLGSSLRAEEAVTTSVSHNAGTAAQWDEKVTRVIPGGATVAGIRANVDQSAATMQSFADQLQQLVALGYSSAVVTDVANLGVANGAPIAAALLQAGSADVAAINAGYVSMASAAAAAGQTVAGQAYGGQIALAQKQADAASAAVTLAQKQLDAANANAATINASIVSGQKAIVDELGRTLGNTITKRADGGFRTAQMAPAGANILWAEPETGGESYIPHAASKRARSTQILAATAAMFGMQLIPATTMANGGMRGSTGNGAIGSIAGDTFDFSNGHWMGTPEQVMRAARREADARKSRAYSRAGLGKVLP